MENTRIKFIKPIMTPDELFKLYDNDIDLTLNDDDKDFIINGRNEISSIIHGKSKKFMVIIGPCSIHNITSALQYADYVKKWINKYGDKIFFVMRTCFEKPRTIDGWKGFINDPNLDGSCD